MYIIEKKSSGYLLTFEGNISVSEMSQWYGESQMLLETEKRGAFGMIIDMRKLNPLSAEAQKIMVNGQQLYRKAGLNRSAVIVTEVLTKIQFEKLAKQSGIYNTERYISSLVTPDFQNKAIDWVCYGINPDIK